MDLFHSQSGFYYDSFMGTNTVSEDDLAKISTKAQEVRMGNIQKYVKHSPRFFEGHISHYKSPRKIWFEHLLLIVN